MRYATLFTFRGASNKTCFIKPSRWDAFADDTLMYQTVNKAADRTVTVCFSPTSHICLHGLTHGVCLSMLRNAKSCASTRNRLHLLLTTLLMRQNNLQTLVLDSVVKVFSLTQLLLTTTTRSQNKEGSRTPLLYYDPFIEPLYYL